MGFLRKIFRKYIWLPFLCFFIMKKMPKIKTMDALETINYLVKTGCSCVRFGDGELAILANSGHPGFQNTSEKLKNRMQEVITSQQKNLLVCVTGFVNCKNLEIFDSRAKYHFRNVLVLFHNYLLKALIPGKCYGDPQFTRPYMDTLNKEYADKIFQSIKKIFLNKTIVIVEGSKTRFGVGNDLLQGSNKVIRILAPAVNAFDEYDEIFQKALEIGGQLKKTSTPPQDILFLLALGPTAKPLTFDLTNSGYRVIDIGHMDIEYEWYLRGATSKIPIPGKYVNETKEGEVWTESEDLDLEKYNREIVACIGK